MKKILINHNKSLFNNLQSKDNKILIENNNMCPNYIAVSYFSNVLSKIHDAELVGYQPRIKFGLYNKLKFSSTSIENL